MPVEVSEKKGYSKNFRSSYIWHNICKYSMTVVKAIARVARLAYSWGGGLNMKVAAIARTMVHTDAASLMETLSTSCVSFLSALRPKLHHNLIRREHSTPQHAHSHAPQPVSPCIMLLTSDMGGGSHDILS
jgi:hypothetical protein